LLRAAPVVGAGDGAGGISLEGGGKKKRSCLLVGGDDDGTWPKGAALTPRLGFDPIGRALRGSRGGHKARAGKGQAGPGWWATGARELARFEVVVVAVRRRRGKKAVDFQAPFEAPSIEWNVQVCACRRKQVPNHVHAGWQTPHLRGVLCASSANLRGSCRGGCRDGLRPKQPAAERHVGRRAGGGARSHVGPPVARRITAPSPSKGPLEKGPSGPTPGGPKRGTNESTGARPGGRAGPVRLQLLEAN